MDPATGTPCPENPCDQQPPLTADNLGNLHPLRSRSPPLPTSPASLDCFSPVSIEADASEIKTVSSSEEAVVSIVVAGSHCELAEESEPASLEPETLPSTHSNTQGLLSRPRSTLPPASPASEHRHGSHARKEHAVRPAKRRASAPARSAGSRVQSGSGNATKPTLAIAPQSRRASSPPTPCHRAVTAHQKGPSAKHNHSTQHGPLTLHKALRSGEEQSACQPSVGSAADSLASPLAKTARLSCGAHGSQLPSDAQLATDGVSPLSPTMPTGETGTFPTTPDHEAIVCQAKRQMRRGQRLSRPLNELVCVNSHRSLEA